jgi:long-chain acyl-CoA synthetase
MHPANFAKQTPGKAAIIMSATGEVITYRQMEQRSNQAAQLFRSLGLKTGDCMALYLENHPRYFEICWAAQRAGLYYTCIPASLTTGEVEYILRDSGARLVVTSLRKRKELSTLVPLLPNVSFYSVDGPEEQFIDFERACAQMPATSIADETAGVDMLYSSGTTGRPKGIKHPLKGVPIDAPNPILPLARDILGFCENTIYLSPAPLYHAAPLRWSMTVHRCGGTVIVMDKFDAENALALIQQYKVTASQWVPTHFIRMLKMPEAERNRYDLSSHRCAIHAAAPCPIPVKEAMIDWWGPIIHEYYGGSEGNGLCYISSRDWLSRRGSVGRTVFGTIKICDENGDEVSVGNDGGIYFANGNPFTYHNDPEKTAGSRNKHGWTTIGDVGHVDTDGYLYLTDRKAFMIISGGVNIYPQELENLLVTHPKVADAAVIGAPDEEMGEKVVAVVQPLDWTEAGASLRDELMTFARANISHIKAPKQIDFLQELPRTATGKLYKRLLRDGYWRAS